MNTPRPTADNRPRIVILGGGFAGAYCARELSSLLGDSVDILVINEYNYFVFHPLLVEAGIGHLEPRHVIVPLRDFLPRDVRLRVGDVAGVDPDKHEVTYRITGEDEPRTAEYEHLVIALGSVTAFPPIPGVGQHAFQVKSLGDAIALRDHVVRQMERANVARTLDARRRLLRMVVVGGSYTGAEVAGEFQHYYRQGIRLYRHLRPEDAEVVLIERGPRILPALNDKLAESATRRLVGKGVSILTGRTPVSVTGSTVQLDDGRIIETETLVWTAGIAQNPIAAAMPLATDPRGILICDVTSRVEGTRDVWAIGDCASNLRPEGGFYPPTAQAAVRLGVQCARNVARAIQGQSPRPIRFIDQGSLCVLGSHDGVADVMGVSIAGFPAWWLWRTIYLMKMPGIGRKLRVATDWTIGLITHPDIVQVGMKRSAPPRLAPPD